ncbi:MAG: ATP-binding protein [Candidatus Bipolaricaulia bacterium]
MANDLELERKLSRVGRTERTGTDKIPLREIEGLEWREFVDEEIGRIVIPEQLSLSITDSNIHAYIPESRRDAVAIGDYVVIPLGYQAQRIFARIESLAYIKRNAIDDMNEVYTLVNADHIGEDEYIETAKLHPISMFGDDLKVSEVRYIPKPNTIVRRVASEDEVKTGLDIPDDGLFLGYVAVNGETIEVSGGIYVPYYLRNDPDRTGDPLIFIHTLIAGMSGRGKTHVAKNFLRQIVGSTYRLERRGGVERKPCIVVIDPENEYHMMSEAGLIEVEDRKALLAQGVKIGGIGNSLRVFAAVEHGARYRGADRYTPFTIPFELVDEFPYMIAGGDLNESQYDALVMLVKVFFGREGDHRYADFQAFIQDNELMERYAEQGTIHPATFKALRRRVDKPHFARIFDQDGGNPITELYEEMFDEDIVSVFPTDHLSATAERVMVLTVMSMIADAKTRTVDRPWGRRIARYPIILAVDEAHNYLTSLDTQQDKAIAEKFVNAAKQGRKNRLGLVLISQNPQDINEGVLSQISNRILLGMERKMAEKAGAPPEYQRALPYFERGRMIVHSPDNSHPLEIIGLKFCVVKH